ncbi:MAG TPA: hypothetical protein VM821_06275 [Abditibacteriaceae bacterium]|jgi:rod shape-determining protein MreD|nr:hypothetical protein [Abditibacteriaceae bacterium]
METPTWRIWPLLLLSFALQTTWLARLQVWGVHLDLPLLAVLCVSLILDWRTGMVFGLVSGLVTGYLLAKNPGALALSSMITGAVLGLTDRDVWRDNPLMPPILAAAGTLLADLIVLLMAPTDFPISWWLHHTPIRMMIHALLIWPIYWILARWLKPPSRLMFG